MTNTKPECEHETFDSHVNVNRFSDQLFSDQPRTFVVELRVICTQCRKLLEFRCPVLGLSFTEPAVSPDGTEIRLPAEIAQKAPLFARRAGLTIPEEN
jgi:hypothetical protein